MERSESDKLKPPSVQGAFARKRREKAEREGNPTWEPYVAPTPQQEPHPPAAEVTPEAVEESAVPAPETVAEPEPVQTEVTALRSSQMGDAAVFARATEEPEAPAGPRREPKQRTPKEPKATTPRIPRPATAPKPPRDPKAARTPRTPKAPRTPKPARAPKVAKVARGRRIPSFIPTLIAGACAGGVLVGLVAVFNRWGGQTDSINALELLGSFLAAIAVGFVVLAVARISHRAAVSFLGVGLVAVVLMFFPSDRWQTVTGGIIVVVATAVAYVAAHAIAREATSDR